MRDNLLPPVFRPWDEVLTIDPEIFRPYVNEAGPNLNFGCAGRPIKGWKNYDPNIIGVDGIDLRVDWQDPFYQGEFKTILAWHVLEHIESTSELFMWMRRFYALLSPGGHLIACCPHAQSNAAFGSPFHVRFFTDQTWSYFVRKPYEVEDTMGYMANEGEWIPPWELVTPGVVLDPRKEEEVRKNYGHYWNISTDTFAVYRK